MSSTMLYEAAADGAYTFDAGAVKIAGEWWACGGRMGYYFCGYPYRPATAPGAGGGTTYKGPFTREFIDEACEDGSFLCKRRAQAYQPPRSYAQSVVKLTARQRAWAQQRGTLPVSGARMRAQRHVLVTWLYHRRRTDDVAAQWATVLDADEAAVEQAGRELAHATGRLLESWGNDVSAAIGRTGASCAA